MNNTNNTIIALDIGDSSIGVAASDPSGVISMPLETIKRTSKVDDMKKLKAICEARNANKIVVGLPLDINGEEGPQAKKVKKYVSNIKRSIDCEIIYVDERYTSKMANNTLNALNIKRGKQKGYEDALAASYILEIYLKQQNR